MFIFYQSANNCLTRWVAILSQVNHHGSSWSMVAGRQHLRSILTHSNLLNEIREQKGSSVSCLRADETSRKHVSLSGPISLSDSGGNRKVGVVLTDSSTFIVTMTAAIVSLDGSWSCPGLASRSQAADRLHWEKHSQTQKQLRQSGKKLSWRWKQTLKLFSTLLSVLVT